jgi:hypothetical protein
MTRFALSVSCNFYPASASFVDMEGDFCLIPPNSFALAETVGYLEIPRDILGICVGKSTVSHQTVRAVTISIQLISLRHLEDSV